MDFPLEGEWKFLLVPAGQAGQNEDERAAEFSRKDLDESGWESIRVPGYWDAPSGGWPWAGTEDLSGPHPEHDGEAWYRLRFTIPENRFPEQQGSEDFHASLRLQGVSAQASVWLNGTFVGRHLGAFSPFEINITEALLKDEPNILSIRVRDKAAFHAAASDQAAEGVSRIPLGFDPNSGGIHGAVSIRITPRERILDLGVQSNVDSATIEVTVSPESIGSSTLSLEIFEATGSNRIAAFGGVAAPSIPAAAPVNRIFVGGGSEGTKLRPWSPESPVRYRLVAKLSNAKGGVDVAETVFGFRSFTIAEGGFQLNGRPYFLFGAASPPHFEKPSDNVIQKHLQELSDAGVRMVRFTHEPPSPKWLELCDEVGLLAWVDGPLSAADGPYDFTNPDLIAAASQEMQDLARSLRNHPSLAIWSMGSGNCRSIAEVGARRNAAKQLGNIAEVVSAIDRDALILPESDSRGLVDSPIEDWRSRLGWSQGREGDWRPFLQATAGRVHGATAPWVCSDLETGCSSAAQGRVLSDPQEEAAARMRIGTSGEDRNRLLYAQSMRIRRLIEQTRAERNPATNRIAGVFPSPSANWFFHSLLEKEMRAKPLLAAIREAYQPVILSIELPKKNFSAGELLETTVTVVNDSPEGEGLKGGNLILEAFVGADELNSQTQRENLEVKPNSSLPYSMVLVLPEITQGLRRTTIRARLFVGNEEAAVNQTEILVAPADWSRPRLDPTPKGLLVHDPTGRLAPYFEKVGLKPQAFQEFDQLAGAVGLVVGPGGFDDHLHRGWPIIRKWIEAGGTMAVAGLEPVEDRWSFSGPYPAGFLPVPPPSWPTGIDRVNVSAPGHPLFEGVRLESLEEWGKDRVVVRHILEPEQEGEEGEGQTLVNAAVFDGALSWGKVVVEERLGEGSLLYSQLDLAAKATEDPIACRVLSNLFEWAASSVSPVVFDPGTPGFKFLDPLIGETRNQVTANFGGTGENDPIRALVAADGPFEATTCCGIDSTTKTGVRPLPNEFGPEKRVYYDLDDRFWYDQPGRAEITILVNCLAPTKIRLDYDSDDATVEHLGHYKQSKVVDVLEVGLWKEVVFSAPQARFANRQRNEADFRLTTVSGEAIYGPITVKRVE